MSKDNQGGPAFPVPGLQECENFNGMSMRDYFAAKAMRGIIGATLSSLSTFSVKGEFDSLEEAIAIQAYEFADAMIKVRTS